MYINHVHSTAIAVYAGRWYYKPESNYREWLDRMNRIVRQAMAGDIANQFIIVERVADKVYVQAISGIDDWTVIELPSDFCKDNFESSVLEQIQINDSQGKCGHTYRKWSSPYTQLQATI